MIDHNQVRLSLSVPEHSFGTGDISDKPTHPPKPHSHHTHITHITHTHTQPNLFRAVSFQAIAAGISLLVFGPENTQPVGTSQASKQRHAPRDKTDTIKNKKLVPGQQKRTEPFSRRLHVRKKKKKKKITTENQQSTSISIGNQSRQV